MAVWPLLITDLAVELEENSPHPACLCDGTPSANPELTQHLLFTLKYSDGGIEVARGNFVGRGADQDCYKMQSKALGGLVVKLQRSHWAQTSNRLAHELSSDVTVRQFVMPFLWHSETVGIAIKHHQNTERGKKWAVFVTHLPTCDVMQAVNMIVGNPMTDDSVAVLLGLLRNVLGLLLRAQRAGLHLGDLHIQHLAFDGDFTEPDRGVIKILDYEAVKLAEPSHRRIFKKAMTTVLNGVASLMAGVSGWDTVASEISLMIDRHWKDFDDADLCGCRSVEELINSISLEGRCPAVPMRTLVRIRSQVLAFQRESRQSDMLPSPPLLPLPPSPPPQCVPTLPLAGSACAPRSASHPAQNSQHIKNTWGKTTLSLLPLRLGVIGPESELPGTGRYWQVQPWHFVPNVSEMDVAGCSGADPGRHVCVLAACQFW